MIVDERKTIADVSARFEVALAKSDKLKDDDVTLAAKIVIDRTNVEEARLDGARVRISAARDNLITYYVAKLGSAPRTAAIPAILESNDDEVPEKHEKK